MCLIDSLFLDILQSITRLRSHSNSKQLASLNEDLQMFNSYLMTFLFTKLGQHYSSHDHTPTPSPTPLIQKTPDISAALFIFSCLGLVFVLIGLTMHLYRIDAELHILHGIQWISTKT